MACPDRRFGVDLKNPLNPDCLDPRPLWPPGNNGLYTAGVQVAGTYTTGPTEFMATSMTNLSNFQQLQDNVFEILVTRTQWDSNLGITGEQTSEQGTSLVEIPRGFQNLDLLTGAFTKALRDARTELNAQLSRPQILDLSVQLDAFTGALQDTQLTATTGCYTGQVSGQEQQTSNPTAQAFQFQVVLGSGFVQDNPTNQAYPSGPSANDSGQTATGGTSPLCYVSIAPQGRSSYTFAGALTGPAFLGGIYKNPVNETKGQNLEGLKQLVTGTFNNGDKVTLEYLSGSAVGLYSFPTGALMGPYANFLQTIYNQEPFVNVQTLMPDFNVFGEVNDLQFRSTLFNPKGISTLDNQDPTTSGGKAPINQSEPPWVYQPGLGLSWIQFEANLTGNPTGSTCLQSLAQNVCSNGIFTSELETLPTQGTSGLTYLNPINGQCQRRPDQDPCLNPCVRDPNSGQLQPNSQVSQCRVFPNLSDANALSCPTVCPKQCVELWETCPEGTGLLTTLYQQQNASDVMSLQGPQFANGLPNPGFPVDKNGTNQTAGPWPNPSRPYRECQAFGTQFCELALGNIQPQPPGTASGLPSVLCAAPCPNGFINLQDFCSGTNSTNPLFQQVCTTGGDTVVNPWTSSKADLGPFFNGAQICVPSNGDLSNVLCDPNQFQPWQGLSGTTGGVPLTTKVKGCATKPLSVLQGTTCPQKTISQVNELFSLEWCLNACGENTLIDPTSSTCIATCEGAIWDSADEYLPQWDQFDMFQTGGHCAEGTVCAQANSPGSCPGKIYKPQSSLEELSSIQNHGLLDTANQKIVSKVWWSSLQKDLPQDDTANGITKKQWTSLRNQIQADQEKQQFNPDQFTQCPNGMEYIVQPQNGELAGHCQDTCLPGFKPIRICKSNQQTNIDGPINEDTSNCAEADLIQACLPDCPKNWDADNRVAGLYNCTYKQPGQTAQSFPNNPSEWKICPLDGKYLVVEQTTTTSTNIVETADGTQGPALCVRQPQKRLSTCPIGMYEDPVTKVCTKLCTSNDIQIQTPTGPVCARACANDGRYNQDQSSIQDINVDPKQASRQCSRQATNVGAGADPNAQSSGKQESNTANNVALGVVGFLGVGILIVIVISLFRRK